VSSDRQLDLFVALIGDVPFRDDREAMSVPLVALSKNKRSRIEWKGPSGQSVVVTAPDEFGVATIWDYDILLWAISQINQAMNQGIHVEPRIEFHPYNMLKAIGRNTGGQGYIELKAALDRLTATTVGYSSPSIRNPKRQTMGRFNLLSGHNIEVTRDGVIKAGWLEIPSWLFVAIRDDRDVLAISPRYFDLTRGLDRFLYRLARRHVGRQKEWTFTFRDLHGRSGSAQEFGPFSRDLRKAIERDCLPEYQMREGTGANGPVLIFERRRQELLEL